MKKAFPITGIIIGTALLLISGYLYFFSGQTIFESDTVKITRPQTTVTKSFTLKESDTPYKISMEIDYEIQEDPKENEYPLLSYDVTLVDDNGDVIEKKSSSYSHRVDRGEKAEDPVGNKSDTIPLLTLRDIPTGTYVLSLSISPIKDLDQIVNLKTFSYEIKKNVMAISPLLPVFGLLTLIVSYFLFKKDNKTEKKGTKNKSE